MYPGFEELEEPASYGQIKEVLHESINGEPDEESLVEYFESTVHEGDYSFEDALYTIADSGVFNYDSSENNRQIRDQPEYPGLNEFPEEEWNELADRLPEHLIVDETDLGLGPVDAVNAVEYSDEEKKMRRKVSRGMYEMIKRASVSHSPILDETTDIEGTEDFAEAAWSEFQERYPEANMCLLEKAMDNWTDGVRTDALKKQMEDPESELNKYREFSQRVIKDTFGEEFQMPVMRGHGMIYFAEYDPRIKQSDEGQFPDFRNREEQMMDRDGVEIERNGIDAWKPREITYYAASADRQYEKGVILRQLADPEDMVLVSHTAPRMETSEIILEDDRDTFTDDNFRKMNEQERKTFEEDMIWMYNQLKEQLK
jgi:hypothetical protein